MCRQGISIRSRLRQLAVLTVAVLGPLGVAHAQTPGVIAAGPAVVQPEKTAPAARLSAEERAFLAAASRFGFEQVILGQNGAVRAQDPRVQAFARTLTSAWADETWNVLAVGRRAGAVLPKRISFQQRQAIAALERHPAELYDWALVTLIARDHEAMLGQLDDRARRHDSRAVRALTERVRPVVVEHLKTARELVKDLTPPAG